jgi:hypothetical protein
MESKNEAFEMKPEWLESGNALIATGTELFAKQCQAVYKQQFEDKMKEVTATVTKEMRTHVDSAFDRHIAQLKSTKKGLFDYSGTKYEKPLCLASKDEIKEYVDSIMTHKNNRTDSPAIKEFTTYLLETYMDSFIPGEHVVGKWEIASGLCSSRRPSSRFRFLSNYGRVLELRGEAGNSFPTGENYERNYRNSKLLRLKCGGVGYLSHGGINALEELNFWIPVFALDILLDGDLPKWKRDILMDEDLPEYKKKSMLGIDGELPGLNRLSKKFINSPGEKIHHNYDKQDETTIDAIRVLKTALSSRSWVPLYVAPMVARNELLESQYAQFKTEKEAFDSFKADYEEKEKPFLDLVETRKELELERAKIEKEKKQLRAVQALQAHREQELKQQEENIKNLDIGAILGPSEEQERDDLKHALTAKKAEAEAYKLNAMLTSNNAVATANIANAVATNSRK